MFIPAIFTYTEECFKLYDFRYRKESKQPKQCEDMMRFTNIRLYLSGTVLDAYAYMFLLLQRKIEKYGKI